MSRFCKWSAASVLAIGCLLAGQISAFAQAASPASEVQFDIPVQPLVSALESYAAATGTVATYNGNLASGRMSHAVKGSLKPQAALPILLKGTGLAGAFTTSRAFVVVPASQSPVVDAPRAIAGEALLQQDMVERRYAALVQSSVNDALCAQALTEPGTYRAAMRIWIGPDGALTRVSLLNSTGDTVRDAAIAAMAGRVSIGEPPPGRMSAPLTMVLLPRSSGGDVICPAAQARQNG